MRSEFLGLGLEVMRDSKALWLEVDTVSQIVKRGSWHEIPARRSTTEFSLSCFL